ncbi:esterase/lipase family protein [Tenuibacillus multivorans]|uniref:Triacylglycerol lipase n=1 Tax=Tenuibacillus multivorans TaxID=237069 RepID=A0A1H0AY22_9BACI|nr:alpha/beta hydrolase [Tenuibacillus multivorans]GEL77619.1 hypothetical protein TMU01_18540 [Tenuibacillus multivorans]SDN38289.1 hypothetical protein SAMN05216498_2129 [Tenuibacillus multivorans]
MLKKIAFLCLIVAVIAGANMTLFADSEDISDPQPAYDLDSKSISGKAGNGNDETPGEWYIGDTPPNLDPSKPILLFVPGLNNVAQVWWEDNDMYQTAYDAGFQTTFVQLHDAGGESADMWDNGELLAEKIVEISNHFGGKPITVVAYSKGGVDTQSALTYYDAHQYVDNVITLSSPHHGSQLADLAYSSWSSWLADLLGAQGDGTYSMQMAEMNAFRNQTDPQPLAYYNDYYTLGGTDWGSTFSSTWYGGMYLSQHGDNDGVVTVDSSRLPGGQELAIGDWNHTTVRTGDTFSVFENYISSSQLANNIQSSEQKNKTFPSNQWVHGSGLEQGKHEITIPIEENVKALTLNLLTSQQPNDMVLVDPTGKTHQTNFKSTKFQEGVFKGGISHATTIESPQSGEWTLKIHSGNDNAYLLLADFKAPEKYELNKHVNRHKSLELTYNLKSNTDQVNSQSLQTTYRITESGNPSQTLTYTQKGEANHSQHITLNQPNQVYNVTIDIEGKTKTGETFKRTIIESVKVPGTPYK